jgi:hypothetical protein
MAQKGPALILQPPKPTFHEAFIISHFCLSFIIMQCRSKKKDGAADH